MSFIDDLWKGHVLAFERPLERLPDNRTALKFILAFLLSGVVLLQAGRQMLERYGAGDSPAGRLALVSALVVLSVAFTHAIVGGTWKYIGLRPLTAWSRREALYAAQVVPAAAAVFFILFRSRIDGMIAANGVAGFLLYNLAFAMLWGFFQEFAYRGLLQTALSTWFGPVLGVVLANCAFTFGTLHASVWAEMAGDPGRAILFVPIFAIGLVFGVVFQRSGNLWLPAIFHGLWPLNMA